MTPSRRFNLGPDRSGKTVERYIAVYMDRMEGAEMSFEAKSDRAAARIAASYQVQRRGAFEYQACTLVGLLKFTDGYYWRGLDKALIERYNPFKRQCAGCLQRKPKAWMREVGGDWLCRTCLDGIAVIAVELGPLDVCKLPQFDVELRLPSVPIFEERNQTV